MGGSGSRGCVSSPRGTRGQAASKGPASRAQWSVGSEKQDPLEMFVAVVSELERARSAPLASRKHFFIQQCRRWHPDKNRGDEMNAKCIFQLLQERKEWFLADN